VFIAVVKYLILLILLPSYAGSPNDSPRIVITKFLIVFGRIIVQ